MPERRPHLHLAALRLLEAADDLKVAATSDTFNDRKFYTTIAAWNLEAASSAADDLETQLGFVSSYNDAAFQRAQTDC